VRRYEKGGSLSTYDVRSQEDSEGGMGELVSCRRHGALFGPWRIAREQDKGHSVSSGCDYNLVNTITHEYRGTRLESSSHVAW
jgi:hypothetical protein